MAVRVSRSPCVAWYSSLKAFQKARFAFDDTSVPQSSAYLLALPAVAAIWAVLLSADAGPPRPDVVVRTPGEVPPSPRSAGRGPALAQSGSSEGARGQRTRTMDLRAENAEHAEALSASPREISFYAPNQCPSE
jgi:hypothetical protein